MDAVIHGHQLPAATEVEAAVTAEVAGAGAFVLN